VVEGARRGLVHRRSRAGLLATVGIVAVVAGGCQYLLGFDPADPTFTEPKPLASYDTGRATITIGAGPAIALDELSPPGTLYELMGADATFRNADGWLLQVSGATSATGFMGQTAYVQLHRITGSEHWTTWDPSRCIVTIEVVDENALRGVASCKGLRWSDAISGFTSLEPSYIEGQGPFDAEVTFEATGTPTEAG
jgi:hypothetical protein